MKTPALIIAILSLFIQSAFAEKVDTDDQSILQNLSPIGRSVENEFTGENLALVCLDEMKPSQPCLHFQIRDTKDGIAQLIGSEMIVKTIPTSIQEDAVKAAHRSTPTKDYRFLPWVKDLGKRIYKWSDYKIAAPIFYFATFLSEILVADLVISIAKVPLTGAINIFRNQKRNADIKQIRKSVHDLFDQAKITDTQFLLSDRRFQILKTSLLTNFN